MQQCVIADRINAYTFWRWKALRRHLVARHRGKELKWQLLICRWLSVLHTVGSSQCQ